jgi:putative ABC transport system permease protein
MKISFFRLALKNLRRKRVRTLSIVIAGFLACFLIFVGTVTVKSVRQGLEGGMARLGADILVVPAGYESHASKVLMGGEASAFYMHENTLDKVAAVDGVKQASPQLYITSATLICCTMPTIHLVGYDPETDFIVSPWLQFEYEKTMEGVDVMTVGANTMYAVDGAFVSFFGKRFKIKSATLKTGIKFIDYSAFMTMDVARKMIRISHSQSKAPLDIGDDQISSVAVKIEPGADVSEVASRIERTIPGVKTILSRSLVATMKSDVRGVLTGVLAAGILSWAMTVLLMAIVFTMIVNERRRELGLLRAMGATRTHLVKLILLEAAILSAIGSIVGIAGGLLTIGRIKEILALAAGAGGVAYQLPTFSYITLVAFLTVVVIIVSGTLTAIYPAVKVGAIEPYDAIRKR